MSNETKTAGETAAAGQTANEKKTLYFEGAGIATPESVKTGVGNCRIRTAFHTRDGRRVYLEILSSEYHMHQKNWKCKIEVAANVDFAHYITGSSEDCNLHHLPVERARFNEIPYTPAAILGIVRECGGDFDEIKVLPDLAGYRVFRDCKNGTIDYNYGDDFTPDWAAVEKREAIKAECHRLEYDARKRDRETGARKWVHGPGGIYPNFSLWVDDVYSRPEVLSWRLCDGEFCGTHEINITAGETARDCIKAATGWNDSNYGDFSQSNGRAE